MRALQNKPALFDRGGARILALAAEYKLPLITGFVFGLAANLYAFTNKFVNADELEYLFSKGATLSSGRWALALTSCIFPDVSMPWIYGVIAVMILTLSACVIICTFEIKGRILQCVLAGLIVSFPVQAMTFTYMFTSASYALAVLLVTSAVCVSLRDGSRIRWAGIVLLALALGIYQAYVSLASGLFVAYLIRRAMDREWSWQRMLRGGIWCLAVLAGGLALYFVVNKLVMTLTATEYNAYAAASITFEGLGGLRNAYDLFFKGIMYRYLLFVPSRFSRLLHLLLAGITALTCLYAFVRKIDWGKRILLALLVMIYPLSVNCLAAVTPGQHTVEYFSFYVLYVIFASLADSVRLPKYGGAVRDASAMLLALLVCVNTVFSNMVFLKQRLVYEESYGLCQQLVSRIKALPEYTGGEQIVLAGRASGAIYCVPEISMWNIPAVRDEVISIYSRDRLLHDYLGLDEYVEDVNVRNVDFGFDPDETFMELYSTMSAFPAEGSIIKRGESIIVKLE